MEFVRTLDSLLGRGVARLRMRGSGGGVGEYWETRWNLALELFLVNCLLVLTD